MKTPSSSISIVPWVLSLSLGTLVFLSFVPILPLPVYFPLWQLLLLEAACFGPLLWRHVSENVRSGIVTLYLLALLNWATTPIWQAPQSPTLPPHLFKQIRYVTDVMPGFNGIETVTTDEKGYRPSSPIDYAHKPAGTLRIVAIGASTTEQIYLDDKKTWTTLLAQKLGNALGKKVEVINTGLSGMRAEYNYYTFKRSAAWSPDVAIFLLGINDWDNHIRRKRYWDDLEKLAFWPFIKSFTATFNYQNSAIARGLDSVSDLLEARLEGLSSSSSSVIQENGDYFSRQNNSLERPFKKRFSPPSVSGDYAYWVAKIVDECHARGIRCIFLDQPTAYQADITPELRRRLLMTPPNATYTLPLEDLMQVSHTYNEWIKETAARAHLDFCPVAASMPADITYFYDDCHYNEGGAARMAELIFHCVMKR